MVVWLAINALFWPIAGLIALACVNFAIEHHHWDTAMTIVLLWLVAATVGVGGSVVGMRHADELVQPRNKGAKNMIVACASAGAWYLAMALALCAAAAVFAPW